MMIKRNRKNHELYIKLGSEITHGSAMKRRQCSAIFVGNLTKANPFASAEGCKHFRTASTP